MEGWTAGKGINAEAKITGLVCNLGWLGQGQFCGSDRQGLSFGEAIGGMLDAFGKAFIAELGQPFMPVPHFFTQRGLSLAPIVQAQLGDAVALMDQMTQQNAQLVEDMTEAARDLKVQSSGLVETVAIFKLA